MSWFILLFCWNVYPHGDHAIYISVVEVDDSEIKVKVFSDDLQDALRNYSNEFEPAEPSKLCVDNQALIQQYFQEKLKVKINGSPVRLSYSACTIQGDSHWISFSFSQRDEWKTIEVEDTHFIELFPSQSNIIKILGTDQRFCRLTKAEPSCSVTF